MDTTPDHAIRDIESSRPRLKAGLKMAYREYAGEPGWLIEEPFSGRFFRVGAAEKHFIDQLDGRRTVAEIIAELSRFEGSDVLEAGRLEALIRALSDSGLLATVNGRHDERLHDEMSEESNTNRLLGRASSALFCGFPWAILTGFSLGCAQAWLVG